MNTSGETASPVAPRARRAGYAAIALVALALRLVAARDTYPAPTDVGHFIQYAIALASGQSEGLPTYWSQGPVVIAAAALRAGWNPETALLVMSLVSGLMVAVLSAALAWILFQRASVALLAGLWVAVNPVMIQYSVTGYSEMPYTGCMLFAWWCVERWHRDPSLGLGQVAAGLAAMALGAYFRGTESCLVGACLLLRIAFSARAVSLRRAFAATAAGAVPFLLVMLPLLLFTYERSGSFLPGSKSEALFVGAYAFDSKATYASQRPADLLEKEHYLQQHGTLGYMFRYRGELARLWIENASRTTRYLNDAVFLYGFRMGRFWFLLLAAWAYVAVLRRHGWQQAAVLSVPYVLPLGLMCLVCIFPRYVAPAVPFVAVAVSFALCDAVSGWSRPRIAVAIAGCFLALNAAAASKVQTMETFYWRYDHMREVGRRLRAFGDDRDVLMTQGPHAAIYFYTSNALQYVELPYGSVDDVERVAGEKNATLLVISDQCRPHWPIVGVFSNGVPPGWDILDTMRFTGDEDAGVPDESYLLIRRPAAAAAGGAGGNDG